MRLIQTRAVRVLGAGAMTVYPIGCFVDPLFVGESWVATHEAHALAMSASVRNRIPASEWVGEAIRYYASVTGVVAPKTTPRERGPGKVAFSR